MARSYKITFDIPMIIICPVCDNEFTPECIEDAFSWTVCNKCKKYEGQYYGYTMEFDSIYFDDLNIINQYDKEKKQSFLN